MLKEFPQDKVFFGSAPESGGISFSGNRYDAAANTLTLNGRIICVQSQGHSVFDGGAYGSPQRKPGVSPRLQLACTELIQYVSRGVLPAKGADGLSPGGLDLESNAMAFEGPAANVPWGPYGPTPDLGIHAKWGARSPPQAAGPPPA